MTLAEYDSAVLSTILQGKYAEAEPLDERCQAIEEKVLGPEHPSLASTIRNRACLLKTQVRVKYTFLEFFSGNLFNVVVLNIRRGCWRVGGEFAKPLVMVNVRSWSVVLF